MVRRAGAETPSRRARSSRAAGRRRVDLRPVAGVVPANRCGCWWRRQRQAVHFAGGASRSGQTIAHVNGSPNTRSEAEGLACPGNSPARISSAVFPRPAMASQSAHHSPTPCPPQGTRVPSKAVTSLARCGWERVESVLLMFPPTEVCRSTATSTALCPEINLGSRPSSRQAGGAAGHVVPSPIRSRSRRPGSRRHGAPAAGRSSGAQPTSRADARTPDWASTAGRARRPRPARPPTAVRYSRRTTRCRRPTPARHEEQHLAGRGFGRPPRGRGRPPVHLAVRPIAEIEPLRLDGARGWPRRTSGRPRPAHLGRRRRGCWARRAGDHPAT